MTDIPPQNPDAEDAVLGAALISPAAIDAAAEILTPEDFYRPSNGDLYRAILALHNNSQPVDAVTLSSASGQRERVYELAAIVPASANVAHYARIVKDCALARAVIAAGTELVRLGGDRLLAGPELVEHAQTVAFNLGHTQATRTIDLGSEVHRVVGELVEREGHPTQLLGVPSGLTDLDRVTRGFRPGDLVVLAADTGRGKSALWLKTALHLALDLERPVAAFSLEMSATELIQRALSLRAGIPHDRLTRSELSADEWSRLTTVAGPLSQAPLHLWTDATVRPAGLRSQLRRWVARHPDAALVVVDYLQLLTPDEKTDNRTADVSSISRALKVMAMELQVPVLALSQFHRRMNPDERPHRGNLRESGSIENDASVVLLLHRPDKWDTDPAKRGTAELLIDKNRHGAPGVVNLQWNGERMAFGNLVREAAA